MGCAVWSSIASTAFYTNERGIAMAKKEKPKRRDRDRKITSEFLMALINENKYVPSWPVAPSAFNVGEIKPMRQKTSKENAR